MLPDRPSPPDVASGPPVATADGRVMLYFGDRKTGKSYLARQAALDSASVNGRVCRMAVVVYCTPNTASTDPWPGPTLQAPPESMAQCPRAFALRGGSSYEPAAEWIMAHCGERRIVFLVDEAHRVWPENFSPSSRMAELFHEGRHRGVDLHVISQWPAKLDKRLVYAADETRWFRLHHPRTLEWIRVQYSLGAAQEVAGLPRRTWITVLEDDPPPAWRWKWSQPLKGTEHEQRIPEDAPGGGDSDRRLSPPPRQARRDHPPRLAVEESDDGD